MERHAKLGADAFRCAFRLGIHRAGDRDRKGGGPPARRRPPSEPSGARAATEDGKAVLKGKVWKRGDPEPQAWTIEAVDVEPNRVGSPGLFGNAQVSEAYIDNVSVTKNAS